MCKFILSAIIGFYWSVSCTMQLMSSRATAFQNMQHVTAGKDLFIFVEIYEQVSRWLNEKRAIL